MNCFRDLKSRLKEGLRSPLGDLYWYFYGWRIKRPQMPLSPKSFLFVCRGNICRSPFAEHLAKRIAKKNQPFQFHFGSAGIEVGNVVPPPDLAKEVAKNFGVNLDAHLSKSILQVELKGYDMVVVMEVKHLKVLARQFPELGNKIFLLPFFETMNSCRIFGSNRYNIPDPYGKDRDEFIRCFKRIKVCVEHMLTEVIQRMTKESEKC